MRSRSIVIAIIVILLLVPSPAFAQDDGVQELDIRSRLAAFVERFVTGEADSAETIPPDPTTDTQSEDAPLVQLPPQTITALVAGLILLFAIGLVARGYQTPTKRDPFRSKL